MTVLGNGLLSADHNEEALSVQEANLSMLKRIDAGEKAILSVQSNLASTYQYLGRLEEALSMRRDTYSGTLNIEGEESSNTHIEALNYTNVLLRLKRFEEAKSLLRKTMPVARRILGESHETTLLMRSNYAVTLYVDPGAMLDDLREAVTTLEEIKRIARRVLGAAQPLASGIERSLQNARAALRARETQPSSGNA